ncbi:BQ2448_7303 [Microbotryum intermedium]|uniref:BQ2448_7303 protein n=1 Tax=Microbotryum intermedium TaxID=269621 RepID=A0A238FJF8_9BASI|nr:BQ2448_7303 [Microbotryum intermedium]
MFNTISTDISSLESLLTTLDRARQALPTILRSFSSTTTSSSIEALSRAYRTSSLEAVDALRTLGDQLTLLDPILVRAQQSQVDDAQGILVKARLAGTQQQQEGDDTLWAQLNALAQHQQQQQQQQQQQSGKGTSTSGTLSSRRLSRRNHQDDCATFAPPKDRHELQAILQGWKVRQGDKVLECEIVEPGSGIDQDPETTEIKVVLRAVMKAYVSIHWETSTTSGGEDGTIASPQVERVACFGLNETKSSYLASQFVLFQNLTRTAMELIEQARSSPIEPASGSQSDLEQVLTFLTDPPLPF